jgi:hypothetical protein
MKSLGKSVLKGLLIAAFFTTGSIALSTIGINSVNKVEAATYNQVNEYLLSHGYTVVQQDLLTRYDWIATTIKDGRYYQTTVYCTATSVIGHSDVTM